MALINTTTTGIQGSTFVADGTGSLTVQQNGVTLGTYGNIPAFSAYASAAQTVTTNTDTKVLFDTEQYDTNNNFASSRFTPTVAGYYQLNTRIRFNGTSPSQYVLYWYKNGASVGLGAYYNANLGVIFASASTLEYMNGTTDYFEIYANITATSPSLSSTYSNTSFFSGFLAKAT